jgi:hypothetical protein
MCNAAKVKDIDPPASRQAHAAPTVAALKDLTSLNFQPSCAARKPAAPQQ